MKNFTIQKKEKGSFENVYFGKKPPFPLSNEKYIEKKLLDVYGPGRYRVKSSDEGKEKVHFEGDVKEKEYRTWTVEERRRYVHERYHGRREKSIAFSVVIVTSVLLMYSIYYTLAARLSPVLAGVLIIALFFFIAFSVFFFDSFLWESE